MFNVEELALLHGFSLESRDRLIKDISGLLKQTEDTELIEIMERTLAKLNIMTDEEFAIIDLSIIEDGVLDE